MKMFILYVIILCITVALASVVADTAANVIDNLLQQAIQAFPS